jgi:hypothetical protein
MSIKDRIKQELLDKLAEEYETLTGPYTVYGKFALNSLVGAITQVSADMHMMDEVVTDLLVEGRLQRVPTQTLPDGMRYVPPITMEPVYKTTMFQVNKNEHGEIRNKLDKEVILTYFIDWTPIKKETYAYDPGLNYEAMLKDMITEARKSTTIFRR